MYDRNHDELRHIHTKEPEHTNTIGTDVLMFNWYCSKRLWIEITINQGTNAQRNQDTKNTYL